MKVEELLVSIVSPLLGGLRPVPSQVVIDCITLVWSLCAAFTNAQKRSHLLLLGASSLLMFGSSGLTSRWSISFPMIPFLLLQGLRRLSGVKKSSVWIRGFISTLSILILLAALALGIFFPAIELPPIQGTYNVGVLNFHIPLELPGEDDDEICRSNLYSKLPVRLFYPTLDKPDAMPLLNPATDADYCTTIMRFGAPDVLKNFPWMLHTWRLTRIRAKNHARLLPIDKKLPLVVFSHGLGGNGEVYSYQTMALAAEGYVVLVISHQDGSAPVVQMANGTKIFLDFDVVKLEHAEKTLVRRENVNFRVQELLAATQAIKGMEVLPGGVSIKGRLLWNETTFMGHSFGGATALTAAHRRPDLVQSVVAHEPAVDWMPDDARMALLPPSKLQDLEHTWSGGTGGYADEEPQSMLHEKHLLLLFSQDWRDKRWAASDALEAMHASGRFGSGASRVHTVSGSAHNEFSDTSMLTPLWLARSAGQTGPRNPIDTAYAIRLRTKKFLDEVRSRSP